MKLYYSKEKKIASIIISLIKSSNTNKKFYFSKFEKFNYIKNKNSLFSLKSFCNSIYKPYDIFKGE